jgi:hypothetical protein
MDGHVRAALHCIAQLYRHLLLELRDEKLLGSLFQHVLLRLAPPPARNGGVAFERRRGAVEYKHRPHAVEQQPEGHAIGYI